MVEVLSGLRQAFGMIGAGFEMLNDFMDEVFQGILPASFLAKYGTKGFQGILAERYSQPTAHDDKVRGKSNVPSSANMGPVSRGARVRNSLNSAGAAAGRVLRSPVVRVAGRLAIVAGALELANLVTGIIDEVAKEKLRELYPENFTLFDFSEVVNTMDDMEGFLQDDDTCYSFQLFQQMNRTYAMFPCLALDLKRYNGTTAGTTAISATQCWADAAPSLGQNSLFSCTATSTCCKTATDCSAGGFIPCGTCPVPALDMTNRYGCDGLRQMCVCGVAQTTLSKCSANRQCGATGQCELVASMGGVSYGTIPCGQCPAASRVMCLLQPSGLPGRCVCIMIGDSEYDLCSELAGTRTTVDSSRLCGFLPGQTLASTRWAFDMEDLVMAACAQVSIGVCSTVYQPQGRTLRMVVAGSVRVTSSSSGGRRLLFSDETEGPPRYTLEGDYDEDGLDAAVLHELLLLPGWNRTAAPCSVLARAYQLGEPLGVLETYELHRCCFWRHVGRRLIQRHNLTRLSEHDTFLLSLDDFLTALMSSPDVAVALLRQPRVLLEAALYHRWMRPVRAFGVLLSNQLERFRWLRAVERDVRDARFAKGLLGDDEGVEPASSSGYQIYYSTPRFAGLADAGQGWDQSANETVDANETAGQASDAGANETAVQKTGRRSLLSVQQDVQAVLAYSAQVIQKAQAAQGQIPPRVAGAWSTASFVWPPVYDYYSLETCPIGMSVLHLGRQVVLVNRLYFETFDRPRPPIDRSLRGTLPSWSKAWVDAIPDLPAREDTGRSWASSAFHWGLAALGVRPSHLVAFFKSEQRWSLQWILQTAVQCDLASVLTCARHDRDLIMSSVVFLLLFGAVRVVTGVLGVSFLSILFLLSYPLFILWYAFGMAPTCLPMVPTCLLADIIEAVRALVPEAVLFPDDLLCEGRGALNQTCLRSCAELNFTTWADPLAFAVCDTDPATCGWLAGFEGGEWVDPLWTPLRGSMERFGRVVTTPGRALAGHRLCTWVMFVTATPVLALLVSALVVASAVCVAVLDLIPSVVALLAQLYAFHSTT
jgi:hypothetical protein